ncbi:BldC family transcriptional regulator [Rhodococcus sp. ARC_M6]|uniref:BldC family transcriptional regulator n=1 Tax=Rhodococcus sp. ARC_M6 TaxID=2928852 RepID=UPI0035B05828
MRIDLGAREVVSGVEEMTVDAALPEAAAVTSRPIDEEFLTPKEVAVLFHVNSKTVGRWARTGKIRFTTTIGGHRRYRSAEVHALLRALALSPSGDG